MKFYNFFFVLLCRLIACCRNAFTTAEDLYRTADGKMRFYGDDGKIVTSNYWIANFGGTLIGGNLQFMYTDYDLCSNFTDRKMKTSLKSRNTDGLIAFRGGCSFLQKAENAAGLGASALIIINKKRLPLIPMMSNEPVAALTHISMIEESDWRRVQNELWLPSITSDDIAEDHTKNISMDSRNGALKSASRIPVLQVEDVAKSKSMDMMLTVRYCVKSSLEEAEYCPGQSPFSSSVPGLSKHAASEKSSRHQVEYLFSSNVVIETCMTRHDRIVNARHLVLLRYAIMPCLQQAIDLLQRFDLKSVWNTADAMSLSIDNDTDIGGTENATFVCAYVESEAVVKTFIRTVAFVGHLWQRNMVEEMLIAAKWSSTLLSSLLLPCKCTTPTPGTMTGPQYAELSRPLHSLLQQSLLLSYLYSRIGKLKDAAKLLSSALSSINGHIHFHDWVLRAGTHQESSTNASKEDRESSHRVEENISHRVLRELYAQHSILAFLLLRGHGHSNVDHCPNGSNTSANMANHCHPSSPLTILLPLEYRDFMLLSSEKEHPHTWLVAQELARLTDRFGWSHLEKYRSFLSSPGANESVLYSDELKMDDMQVQVGNHPRTSVSSQCSHRRAHMPWMRHFVNTVTSSSSSIDCNGAETSSGGNRQRVQELGELLMAWAVELANKGEKKEVASVGKGELSSASVKAAPTMRRGESSTSTSAGLPEGGGGVVLVELLRSLMRAHLRIYVFLDEHGAFEASQEHHKAVVDIVDLTLHWAKQKHMKDRNASSSINAFDTPNCPANDPDCVALWALFEVNINDTKLESAHSHEYTPPTDSVISVTNDSFLSSPLVCLLSRSLLASPAVFHSSAEAAQFRRDQLLWLRRLRSSLTEREVSLTTESASSARLRYRLAGLEREVTTTPAGMMVGYGRIPAPMPVPVYGSSDSSASAGGSDVVGEDAEILGLGTELLARYCHWGHADTDNAPTYTTTVTANSDSAETKIASVPSSCSESTDDGCDSEQKERRNRQSTRSPKIKVGFLSSFLYDHSVGRLLHEVIAGLARNEHCGEDRELATCVIIDVFVISVASPLDAHDAKEGAARILTEAEGEIKAESSLLRNGDRDRILANLRTHVHNWISLPLLPYATTSNFSSSLNETMRRFLSDMSEENFLPSAASVVHSLDLDVLVFPEVGMDSIVSALATFRMAEIQMVFWGHPVSQGIPTIDYFISSQLFEYDPPATRSFRIQERHEQVLLFDGLTTIFERPAMQQLDNIEDLQHRWRSDLGISTEQRIYLLPHTIMKYSPAFDEAIAGVLIRDLDGVVVILTTEEQGIWAESVRSRIYTYILSTLTAACTTKSGNGIKSEFAINDNTGDSNTTTEESVFCSFTRGSCVSVTARVILAPKLPRNLYYAIISDSSVVLDPFPFGMGVTALEAFALGTPVVTLPSLQTVPALVDGMLRQLDDPQIIDMLRAQSIDQYIAKAVHIASSKEDRAIMREKLAANSARLYSGDGVLDDWRRALCAVVRSYRPMKC